MRRSQHRRRRFSSDSDIDFSEEDEVEEDDEDESGEGSVAAARRRRRGKMKCLSCKEEYGARDAGTCRECYEEAGETEEELKREIEDLKAKVNFLRLLSTGPGGPISISRSNTLAFSDVVLIVSGPTDSADSQSSFPSVPAHRAVLTSRSPVFRAMLENEMEESISGTIKVSDASYDALRAFVNYLYTAEACLDEHMACDLLVLAEKYQVTHLKTYCEKFLMSKLNWENSLPYYAFAHQHSARCLLDASLSLIMDNMDKLSKQEEYMELVEKDPRVVVEIYETYVSKQVNTAASKDPNTKS
ncbi:BTB/POZ domain-containing protein [Abeliophyllum distichum]|uniref:BTB/POZ domain-containing protein n=1 Tax=Abeliophyllum distichum TaxID=126358 RepID=A0ABD1SV65_9LAMI